MRCHLLSAAAGPSAALTRSCRGGAPSFIPHRPGWSLAGAGTGQGPVWPRQRPRQRLRPLPRRYPHLLPRGVLVLAPGCQSCTRGPSPYPLVSDPVPEILTRRPLILVSAHRGRAAPAGVPALPPLQAGQGQPALHGPWGGDRPDTSPPSVCPVTGVKVSPWAGNGWAELSLGAKRQSCCCPWGLSDV